MYDVIDCLSEIEEKIRELEEAAESLPEDSDADRARRQGMYVVTRSLRTRITNIRRGEKL